MIRDIFVTIRDLLFRYHPTYRIAEGDPFRGREWEPGRGHLANYGKGHDPLAVETQILLEC
jgi:hypothetical protein